MHEIPIFQITDTAKFWIISYLCYEIVCNQQITMFDKILKWHIQLQYNSPLLHNGRHFTAEFIALFDVLPEFVKTIETLKQRDKSVKTKWINSFKSFLFFTHIHISI